MRSFRHWKLPYAFDRFTLMVQRRKHPEWPWLTSPMIRILESWLQPVDLGFEWGSGNSTIWLAKRVTRLISVEHDLKWATVVKEKLRTNRVEDRVTYRVLPDGETGGASSDYVTSVLQIEDNSLDFCLVDGVARDHCVLACLPKIKPGGIIIIDNINSYLPRHPKSPAPDSRDSEDGFASDCWREFGQIVQKWRCIWTTNGIWDTASWQKPLNMS